MMTANLQKSVATLNQYFNLLTEGLEGFVGQQKQDLCDALNVAHIFLREQNYSDVLGYVAEDLESDNRLDGAYAPSNEEVMEDVDFFLAIADMPAMAYAM